jgi:hypothetical protein
MRDSNDQMIELLDVKYEQNVYSSLVRHSINKEQLRIRFSIIPIDYGRLKKIFQFRPFENTGVAPYRYFFTYSYSKDSEDEDLASMDIRVEQLGNHKNYNFPMSRKYISNLLWINTITDKRQLDHLIEK